jgi:hypothetical protein
VAVPSFLTGYATLDVILSEAQEGFTEQMTRTSALYLSAVVFSSMGFRDIAPTSDLNRIVVMSQMLGGLIFIAAVIRIFSAPLR